MDQLLRSRAAMPEPALWVGVLTALLGCCYCFAAWGAALDGSSAIPPSAGERAEPRR
jgi:hypothetical protein